MSLHPVFPNRIIPLALLGATLLLLLSACSAVTTEPNQASLTVGTGPDDSAAVPLEGAVLYGDVFIEAEASSLEQASFYLDDSARLGAPFKVLSSRPFRVELGTRTLPDGPHTLTLELRSASGDSRLSHTPFTVANAAGEALGYVNLARESGFDCGSKGTFAGTGALRLEPRLIAAAQKHAEDMDAHGYFSHTAKDGSTVSERVGREGYAWSRVAENLAQGYTDAADVVEGWLGSDGHCANLMNPAFTELGVGKSGSIWVQVFARPQ